MRQTLPDVLVIGGGVIGLAIAREAARRGGRVTLVERGEAGREATWAAAGMLSPVVEADGPGPFLDLALRSAEAYPGWVEELEAESGARVKLRLCGKLCVARTEAEMGRLEGIRVLAERHGLRAEGLGALEVREIAPPVGASVRGGLLLHDDGRVDGRALVHALRGSLERAGVELRERTEAVGVEWRGADAVVRFADGSSLAAGTVVLSAGAWSGRVGGLPDRLPIRPVRGQMLSLSPTAMALDRVVESGDVYLVPRDDGRILVGATMEDAGFAKAMTAEGVSGLLRAALELCPDLAEAEIVDMWAGLRPATPDRLPVLGPVAGTEGRLVVATGHFRNGILLAPVTALAVAEVLTEGTSDLLPSDTSPDRFGHTAARAGRD